jgi:NDP-sugar pyrophosphorylase family protein
MLLEESVRIAGVNEIRRRVPTSRRMKAILLAAGEGSRLRPFTERIPKPMIPVDGKPILQHNVEMLARYGIRDIAINLHHCPEAVTSFFGDGSRFGVSLTYFNEPTLMGTAGAIKSIEPFFQETPFVIVYGDNLLKCDLGRVMAFHATHRGAATIGLHYREDAWHCGVVSLDRDDMITQFVEKPKPSEILSHWVSAGVLIVEPQVLAAIPTGVFSDLGKDTLPYLLRQGEKLYGYRLAPSEGPWWIDTPADLERVQRLFGGMYVPSYHGDSLPVSA